MMPRMSNLAAKKDKETSSKYIEHSMIFIMFLSIGMCFGLLSISDSLIYLLYGKEFNGSTPLLNLLSITLIFIGWGNVIRTQFVIPNKKDKIYIVSIALGAICNLIVNALLISNLGAVGACIGTIVAELIVPVYQFIVLRKELPYKRYLKNTVPFLIAGLCMFALCYIIHHKMNTGLLTMVIQILVGGVFYGSISLLYMKKGLKII